MICIRENLIIFILCIDDFNKVKRVLRYLSSGFYCDDKNFILIEFINFYFFFDCFVFMVDKGVYNFRNSEYI